MTWGVQFDPGFNPSATFGTLPPSWDNGAAAAPAQPSSGVTNGINYNSPASNFIYPHDLNQQFCLLLEFSSYNRPSMLSPAATSPIGNIALPIPNELVDRQQLQYTEDQMGAIMGTALNQLSAGSQTREAIKQGGISGLGNIAGALGEAALKQAGVNALDTLGNSLGAKNLTNNALSLGGLAQNPFLTVLFRTPMFKRYTMTWTFAPETEADTNQLKYIINKIRYHSLAGSTFGGTLLTYPDMVKPHLLPTGYQFDFKFCVVENLLVNYVPGDTPSFNSRTLAPSAIRLTLNLLEIELWFKDDITSSLYKS